jgi:hypothetical protein
MPDAEPGAKSQALLFAFWGAGQVVGQSNLLIGYLEQNSIHGNNGCVTLWPCHLHKKFKYRKAKEALWKLKYFIIQKYNLRNNPLKETKILEDIITP